MFDFSQATESTYSAIPAGVYNVIIEKAEAKQTKKGDDRWNLQFTITDGQYRGRKIFEGFNLTGSEKAVAIAKGNIKSLLKAAGRDFTISGPEDLVGIEVSASIKVQPAKDGYDERNTLGSFKPKVAVKEDEGTPF